MHRILAPAVLLALSGACVSLGATQRAQTAGRGEIAVGIEPGVSGTPGGPFTVAYPVMTIAGRYGVTDRLDLSARIGVITAELGVKLQLTDPDAGGVVVSVAPAVGALSYSGTSPGAGGIFAWETLPLLVGVPVGKGQIVWSPRLQHFTLTGELAPGRDQYLTGGSSLGYAIPLGASTWIMPEVAAHTPIVAARAGSSELLTGEVAYSARLGLLFGGR